MMDTIEGCRLGRRLQQKLVGQVILALGLSLFLVACGDEALPTTTAMPTAVPLLPTVAFTPAALPLATASVLVSPLSSLDTQLSAAATTTLTMTASITLDDPSQGDGSVLVGDVTTGGVTTTLTASETLTAAGILGEGNVPLPPCAIETDIALLAYPDIDHKLGCALAPASFDAVALNEFGLGPDYDRFMLWLSSENQIYVLAPEKTWQVFADTWTEEQETFTCNPLGGEASSPPLPRRGFGKIWCTVEGLQTLMGTVEREERLCQHTVTQRFSYGRLIACYEDATIRFFRMMDDHTWDQMLIR